MSKGATDDMQQHGVVVLPMFFPQVRGFRKDGEQQSACLCEAFSICSISDSQGWDACQVGHDLCCI